MVFHPIPARWFEVLVPRQRVAHAMERLARTGLVEFEALGDENRHDMSSLMPYLSAFEHLKQDLEFALPAPDVSLHTDERPLESIAKDALKRIRDWADDAQPLIRALEVAAREEADLTLIHEVLSQLADADPDLSLTDGAVSGGVIHMRLFLLSAGADIDLSRDLTVSRIVETATGSVLLAAGTARSLDLLARDLTAQKARVLELPEWSLGPVAQARDHALERLETSRVEADKMRTALGEAQARNRIPQALGDMIWLSWVSGQMEHFPVTENLGWITGWTAARGEGALRHALDAMNLPYALNLAEPPPEKIPPSLLVNPGWARPFELFGRLLGTPGVRETDPSVFLAVVAPLMFGYMFGDVGHGAFLLLAGLLLNRRIRELRLLIPGGIAAIAFGMLFGEIFGNEHLVPALWVRPLEEPLTILFVPLIGGGFIIALGLLLGGLTAVWRHTLGLWMQRDLGLVVAYAGIWGMLIDPRSVWLAGLGMLWFVGGHLISGRSSLIANLTAGLGSLIENGLRLLVNSISFVRVGAFALAHAGLGVAIASLAEAGGAVGQWPILILGNLLIIVIEGLVVSVQTTRLILFEFFIRFLQATGRPFQPSLPPEWADAMHQSKRDQNP